MGHFYGHYLLCKHYITVYNVISGTFSLKGGSRDLYYKFPFLLIPQWSQILGLHILYWEGMEFCIKWGMQFSLELVELSYY